MAVTLTIEDARHDDFGGPVVTEVPDGSRILVRRCTDGADVLVLPGAVAQPAATMPDANQPSGAALRVSTWGVYARDDGRSFVLRLQDSHGCDHDFSVSHNDLVGIGTASLAVAGHEASYEAACTRRMVAQAKLVELQVAAMSPRNLEDGVEIVGVDRWSVDTKQDRITECCVTIELGEPTETRKWRMKVPVGLASRLSGKLADAVAELLPRLEGRR